MQITIDFNAVQKLISTINNDFLKAWVTSLMQDIPAKIQESNELLQEDAELFTDAVLTNLEHVLHTMNQLRNIIEKGKIRITADGEKKKIPIDEHDQALLRTLCFKLESVKGIKDTLKQNALIPQSELTELTWQTQALYYEQDVLFKEKTITETLKAIKQFLPATQGSQYSCFISYAWPSQQNQEKEFWLQPFLMRLRKQLRQAGIQAILDIQDHKPCDNRYTFASRAENSDFVLLICTESLLEKHRSNNEISTTELNHIEAKCKLDSKRSLMRVFPILVSGTQQISYPEKFHMYATVHDWRGRSYLTNVNNLLKWILRHHYQDQLLKNHSDYRQAMTQKQVAEMQCYETYRKLNEELRSQALWQGLFKTYEQEFLRSNQSTFQVADSKKNEHVFIEKKIQAVHKKDRLAFKKIDLEKVKQSAERTAKNESQRSEYWVNIKGNKDQPAVVLIKALKRKYQMEPNVVFITGFYEARKMPIAECFINLAIVRQREVKQKEQEGLSKPENFRDEWLQSFEDIHQPKQVIALSHLFDTEENKSMPKRLLIEGRAGIGKTTLCCYIANRWAAGDEKKLGTWIHQFTAVIWLPLRQIQALTGTQTLAEWIHHTCLLEADQEDLTVEQVKAALSHLETNHAVLYLLDGYDELAESYRETQAITTPLTPQAKLLRALFQKEYWIVTSRPYCGATQVCTPQRHLENVGFMDTDIAKYIRQFFQDENEMDKAETLLARIIQNDNLKGIAHVPINLELICSLWKEEYQRTLSQNPMTMTWLYQELVRLLARRYLQVRCPDVDIQGMMPEDYETHPRCAQILAFLSVLSWQLMQQGALTFKPKTYAALIEQYFPIPETRKEMCEAIYKHFGLLKGTGDEKTGWADQSYYFLHLTFQEYLAARHLAASLQKREMKKEIWSFFYEDKVVKTARAFIKQFADDKRYEVLFWFLAGLLRNKPMLLEYYFALLAIPKLKRLPEDIKRLFTETNDQIENQKNGKIRYLLFLGIHCLEESDLVNNQLREYLIRVCKALSECVLLSQEHAETEAYASTIYYLRLSPRVMQASGILDALKQAIEQSNQAISQIAENALIRLLAEDPIHNFIQAIRTSKDDESRCKAIQNLGVVTNKANKAELDRAVKLLMDCLSDNEI